MRMCQKDAERVYDILGVKFENKYYDGSKYVSDTYTYQKSGRRYFGYNEFSFTFHDGVLDYFSIDYIP